MIPLPFSLRTVSVTAVFACIFIASPQGATTLTKNPATVGALALSYAQLTNIYPVLCHQDTANNQADLYAAIAVAATAVSGLNTILAGLTAIGDAGFILQGMQIVAANALTSLQNVQVDEAGGGE